MNSRTKWREKRISTFIKSTDNYINFLIPQTSNNSKETLNNNLITQTKKKKFNLMNRNLQKQIFQSQNKPKITSDNHIIVGETDVLYLDTSLKNPQKENELKKNTERNSSPLSSISYSNRAPKETSREEKSPEIDFYKKQNLQNNSELNEIKPRTKKIPTSYFFQSNGSEKNSKYITSKYIDETIASPKLSGCRFNFKNIEILFKSPKQSQTVGKKSATNDNSFFASTLNTIHNNYSGNTSINKSIKKTNNTLYNDTISLSSSLTKNPGKNLLHSDQRTESIRKNNDPKINFSYNFNTTISSVSPDINEENHLTSKDDKSNAKKISGESVDKTTIKINIQKNHKDTDKDKNQKKTNDLLYPKLIEEIYQNTPKRPDKSRLFDYNVRKIIGRRKFSSKINSFCG